MEVKFTEMKNIASQLMVCMFQRQYASLVFRILTVGSMTMFVLTRCHSSQRMYIPKIEESAHLKIFFFERRRSAQLHVCFNNDMIDIYSD